MYSIEWLCTLGGRISSNAVLHITIHILYTQWLTERLYIWFDGADKVLSILVHGQKGHQWRVRHTAQLLDEYVYPFAFVRSTWSVKCKIMAWSVHV